MTQRGAGRLAEVGVAALALVALSACGSGSEPSETEVLGATATNPSFADETTTTTTTVAPTTTAPPATTTVPTRPPRPPDVISVEGSDNGAYVVVDEAGNGAGEGSSIGPITAGESDDFVFHVFAHAASGTIEVEVNLQNTSDRPVEFPDGLRVTVEVSKDGPIWRTVEVADPGVTSLAPGEAVVRSSTLAAEGPGQYSVAGTVTVRRPR